MTGSVLFERRKGVLIITFDRPSYGNTMTVLMMQALRDKLKSAHDDRSIRAVLLRGAGEQFINDQEMSPQGNDANAIQEIAFQKVHLFNVAIREFQEMERPVVAALDGYVSGTGFSLMLASDFTIATKRTVLNPKFILHSLVPDGGVTFSLPRKVGSLRATEILMLSEDFTAEDAEKWGLINKIVADNALESESMLLVEKLAMAPTRILGETKKLLNRSFENNLQEQLLQETTAWTAGSKTFDFREGMKASHEKRAPKFTGA